MLDVGCGTGTHLNFLKDNFSVIHGVDVNPDILRIAKSKSKKIKYHLGKMQNFKINKRFDVIICLYSVFNYNLTKADAIRTLNNFKRHLNRRGLLIVALYIPQNTELKTTVHSGKTANEEVIKINQFILNPKTKIESANFIVLVKKKDKIDLFTENNHKYRIYSQDEFKKLLARVGFSDIKAFDGFQNKKTMSKTKFPVFTAILE